MSTSIWIQTIQKAGLFYRPIPPEKSIAVLSGGIEHGSFGNWLASHHPKTKDEWKKVFKKTFKFTGGEIVNEFLMSIGYLPHAHDENCEVYAEVLKSQPKWLSSQV